MALNSVQCDDVPLRNYSLTHSLTHSLLWFVPYNPFTRHNRLSNRLYNRFDNRLYRVNKHPSSCQTGYVTPMCKQCTYTLTSSVVHKTVFKCNVDTATKLTVLNQRVNASFLVRRPQFKARYQGVPFQAQPKYRFVSQSDQNSGLV